MMKKVYVNCGGNLQFFNTKKDVMDFYEECIFMSEGSERERYTNIYFSVKKHLNDDINCFTDGTEHIYTSNIDPDTISSYDEKQLIKNFKVSKKDLLYFKAANYLSKDNNRIYDSTLRRYNSVDELYDDYLSQKSETNYFFIKNDYIVCIDTSAEDCDKYWLEEFPIKDYEYANKWLKGEIEYGDYLNSKEESNFNLNNIYVKDMLDYKLEEDESSTGGLSFSGETLKDFIDDDIDDSLNSSIFWINDRLKLCGIKEITEQDCKKYFDSKTKEGIEL